MNFLPDFLRDFSAFWSVLKAIQVWENIQKHFWHILDNIPASISGKYTSSSNFTISWHIIFAANVLPFWVVPKAIRVWGNIVKHCRRILDNFLASIWAKYISSSNFMISWHIIFVADVLPFWGVPEAIRMWRNILKDCWHILDKFPASIVAKYTSSSNFTIS